MYNLEFIQLGNKHPQTRLPRYNYKIVPNDQKHKPFLEIKKNNKLFKGSKIIAPDINENHFIKSNENDLIQINNPITHEDKIGEEIDQSFVIDFNEENSFDNTNKNKNNIVSQGSVDIFQTHFLNGIYPPNWEKVNTTCGEVWLELFQICRKRNIPNTVLDCLLGWVNKYFILKNEKTKKLPNYSKYFYSNLMNLLPVIQSEPQTLMSTKWECGKKKWHPSSRRGDIEYCSPIQWINYLVNSNGFENIIISPNNYFQGSPVNQKKFKPMQINETKGFQNRGLRKKEDETLLLISFYYDHHKTGKSSLGGLYMFVENVKSCWRMKDPLIFLIANFPYELKIYDVLKKPN